jgi:AcrR family transcriptional regulator
MSVEQLPSGRHGLSREEVRASQRGRMLVGMASAAAEKGYVKTTVGDVIKRAGVSRETFYEHFSGKEDCFIAAFDAGVGVLLASTGGTVAEATGAEGDPLARLDRVLGTYLGLLAEQPDFARVFLVEVFAAGPRAIERRAKMQQRFVAAIAAIFGVEPGDENWFACEALVAATSSLVTSRIGAGHPEQLAALREPLVDLARRVRLAR